MACVDDETSHRWTEENRLGVCLGSVRSSDLATVATQESVLPSAEIEMLAPMALTTLLLDAECIGPVSVVSAPLLRKL